VGGSEGSERVRFLGIGAVVWSVLLVGVGLAAETLSAAGPAGPAAGYGVVAAFAAFVGWQLWRADRRRRAEPGG
jgi:hypothetical protein